MLILLKKTQISTSNYTKICFKSMKQNLESGLCYVDFVYQKHKYQQANIEKYVSNQ